MPHAQNVEILAPAGSLDHALWALEGGANAVYIGYQKFSARSHADNFSLEDISLLTAVAKTKNARVFCAVNTILGSDEVAEAVALAWELYYRGVDAVIVQDLGLGLALRRHGPPIHLHASTQAAVHNQSGVAAIKALGFCRVVLARELTMDEIGEIVRADPEMEYEVFVHGALCYAVSGNCMASGLMLGRSANRGDCGQVCRTKFELDYLIPGPKRRESPHEEGLPDGTHAPPGEVTWKIGTVGAFTSMNDLELGARIRELRALGVQSFKIEGRMKPPAYSYNTARAYRTFLDGGNDAAAWEWLDEARLRHGRLPSTGWFDGHKALAQTNPGWAGTLGMPLGPVVARTDKGIVVDASVRPAVYKTLGRGDGLMILGATPGQTHRAALDGPASTSVGRAELTLGDRLPFDPVGGTAWLISRHDGKLPVKRTGKVHRHLIPMTLTVVRGEGDTVVLSAQTAEWGCVRWQVSLAAVPATGDKRLEDSLAEIFRASDSRFGPSDLTIDNQAGALFVSPKVLKQARREWYTLLEDRATDFLSGLAATIRAAEKSLATPRQPGSLVPSRASLSPRHGVNLLTGFVTDWEVLKAEHLATTPWGLSLPLAPFTPVEGAYFDSLRAFLLKLRDEGVQTSIFPGLSNPGHLAWMHRLRAEGLALGTWWADWGFHSANGWTPAGLGEALPGLAFAVHWLEDPQCPDRSYFPPLFTSRSCMLRNSFGEQAASAVPTAGGLPFDSRGWIQAKLAGKTVARPEIGPRCPDGCAGHFSARLVQGKKQFRVEARDCINYLILES